MRSRFISTTGSAAVAKSYALRDERRVAEIGLGGVQGEVYDFTLKETRSRLVTNPIARNYAIASQEVTIDGIVPPEAIVSVNYTDFLDVSSGSEYRESCW